jgi:hypothetical protein
LGLLEYANEPFVPLIGRKFLNSRRYLVIGQNSEVTHRTYQNHLLIIYHNIKMIIQFNSIQFFIINVPSQQQIIIIIIIICGRNINHSLAEGNRFASLMWNVPNIFYIYQEEYNVQPNTNIVVP